MTDYPKLKDHPRLKTLLNKVSPGYRKLTVNLVVQDQVSCGPSYWDGGSRTYYAKSDIRGEGVQTVNTSNTPGAFGGSDAPVVVNLAGTYAVVVSGGTFRGKPAHATVYADAENIAWLLGRDESRGTLSDSQNAREFYANIAK